MNELGAAALSEKVKAVKTSMKVLLALAASSAVSVAHATTIDFSGLPIGNFVTNQYPEAVFSLAGGPDSAGAPMIWNYSGTALANSHNPSYPTANILNVSFTAPVSGLSFTFNNYGTAAPTTYTAFDGSNNIISSGSLQFDNSFATVINVAGSGIADLQFNNNFGNDNWYYAVQELTFTVGAPGPVPGAGLAGLAALALAGLFARTRRA